MLKRFWSKVDVRTHGECWEWLAHRDRKGYGRFILRGTTGDRAHRIAWQLHHAEKIPAGMHIDHLCNNTSCVNPHHLEMVTPEVNRLRQAERQTHCNRGHELSEDNVYPSQLPSRVCIKCARARASRRRRSNRLALSS